eukprot:TRINITY_DN4587_c0_g1_i2.p2 TRINITY_DN4587_c0_g1~~TRINITY_DN4587_c0_g1_i2.p2  ORF type:complete len:109 (-),score=28.08 TRINITY_DN4587_c0_g1_i2:177-503(-)
MGPEGHSIMTEDDTDTMYNRIKTILAVGLDNGHDCIVLSAFGCGAFRCPTYHVAKLFKQALEEEYKGGYKYVAFAIINDHNAKQEDGNVIPFVKVFQSDAKLIDYVYA